MCGIVGFITSTACNQTELEARSPFLDPDVVAFSWRLPLDLKISRTQGKIVLKKLLARSLQGSLIDLWNVLMYQAWADRYGH